MASNELIIDDDYCKEMGEYFVKQGEEIDKIVKDYINILNEVKDKAIISGDVNKALSTYISYVKKLNGKIGQLSQSIKIQIDYFLIQVDKEDKYLF